MMFELLDTTGCHYLYDVVYGQGSGETRKSNE